MNKAFELFALLRGMSRAKTILQSEFPYSVSARCINKEWFNLPMNVVWEIFCQELNLVTKDHYWRIHNFVLMSNHFHLIVTTPEANISQCMHQFMGRTSRRLTKEGNRLNETFAGRHYKCILNTESYFLNAYKYTYRNPVTAGICKLVEDYPYSTLRGLLNVSEIKILELIDWKYLKNTCETLNWLNTQPDAIKLEGVRYALKRQIFKSKNSRINNKPLIAENDIL